MPKLLNDASLRHVRALYGSGTCRGLTDGELLERFDARDGPDAEAAFDALVERHGPLVLRVARSILHDRHHAEDAVQAVFLVLARRAGSLWVRDSIAPWLHGVTVRVANRLRADLLRRRLRDEAAASRAPTSFEPPPPDDLGAALHREIARLPDRQRLPVVLCLVEGLTHDQAASRLGWPVGTVRSRLARGRDRLRDRLTRRGLAPPSLPMLACAVRMGDTALPAGLANLAVRSALALKTGGLSALVPAVVSTSAFQLFKEIAMFPQIKGIAGLALGGMLAAGMSLYAQSSPEGSPTSPVPGLAESTTADKGTIVRVYNVSDLAVDRTEGGPHPRETTTTATDRATITIDSSSRADVAPLVDLLTSTVAPGSWTISVPGYSLPFVERAPGSIEFFPPNCSLIIRHTTEVHDEIVTRLRQIRRIVGPIRAVGGLGVEVTEERETIESREGRSDHKRVYGDLEPPNDLPAANDLLQFEAFSTMLSKMMEHRSATPVSDDIILDQFGGVPSDRDRLDALERKLDAILRELHDLRGEPRP